MRRRTHFRDFREGTGEDKREQERDREGKMDYSIASSLLLLPCFPSFPLLFFFHSAIMEHLDHVLPSSMFRIHSNLASVLSQVHASPESPAWAGYLRNVDHVITERLKDTVLTAVGSLLHRAHLYEQVSTQGPVCMKTSVHAVFAMPFVLKWLKHISTMYVHT